jgi:hypothetical protein
MSGILQTKKKTNPLSPIQQAVVHEEAPRTTENSVDEPVVENGTPINHSAASSDQNRSRKEAVTTSTDAGQPSSRPRRAMNPPAK